MSNRLISRTERLAEIERLLFRSTHGLRVIEIAEATGVDRRTIYRDLDTLSAIGIPIWQDEGRVGIVRDQYLTTVRLNFNEAVALFIATRLLSRHADQHNPHIVSALTKLGMAFPSPLASQIALTANAVQQYPIDATAVEVLETLTTGWAEGRKVRIWYSSRSSAGTVRSREILPYFVEPTTQGGLYVIGYDEQSKEIRTFKLQRIRRVQLLEDRFTIPDNFNAEQYFSTAWGIMGGRGDVEVCLLFSPEAASLIKEHHWHLSQHLADLADGSCRLTVHVRDWREMRPWIRSWGSLVKVEQPDELRQDMAIEAAKVLAQYQTL